MTESPVNAGPDESSAAGRDRSEVADYPGTPRWVKVGAIVAVVVLVLVLAIMLLSGGEHGPLRHVPSAAATVTTDARVPSL